MPRVRLQDPVEGLIVASWTGFQVAGGSPRLLQPEKVQFNRKARKDRKGISRIKTADGKSLG